MTYANRKRNANARKRGFTITEATVALFLLAAAATLFVKLTLSIHHLGRQTWRAQLLQEELANLAEHTAALPWEELSAERIGQLPLGEAVRQEYPAAKVQVEIAKLTENSPCKQLTLSLELGSHEAAPRLTVWRYPPEKKP